jgi:hypothetical protein
MQDNDMHNRSVLWLQAGAPITNLSRGDDEQPVVLGQDQLVWATFHGAGDTAYFTFELNDEQFSVPSFHALVDEVGSRFTDVGADNAVFHTTAVIRTGATPKHHPWGLARVTDGDKEMAVWTMWAEPRRIHSPNATAQLVLSSQRGRKIVVELDRRDWYVMFSKLADVIDTEEGL